jgi:hypothetical protein
MTFNRIQALRNSKIKVAREDEKTYFYIQGPTIGELYDDDRLFLVCQILLMGTEELKSFLKIEEDISKLQIITMLLTKLDENEDLTTKLKKIIIDLNIKNEVIHIGQSRLKASELEKVSEVLQILMGQTNKVQEEKLSPDEKRLRDLEAKVKAKKEQQSGNAKLDDQESDKNNIEDIILSVIYEFGFDFEKIMNMNYFTLIWYYSYTSKLHVYRINQHAIGSGMVKKINTDYFTSLK